MTDGEPTPERPVELPESSGKIGGTIEEIARVLSAPDPELDELLDFWSIVAAPANPIPFDPVTGEVTGSFRPHSDPDPQLRDAENLDFD